jgi:hypothetical protein
MGSFAGETSTMVSELQSEQKELADFHPRGGDARAAGL